MKRIQIIETLDGGNTYLAKAKILSDSEAAAVIDVLKLIELDLEVVLGEILQLENEITREKVEGKVVSIRRSRDGKKYVAIEFISEDANFWHMAFPVPGARPLRRPISAKVSSL